MVGSRRERGCERREGKSDEGGLDHSGSRKDRAGAVARGSPRCQIDQAKMKVGGGDREESLFSFQGPTCSGDADGSSKVHLSTTGSHHWN